MNETDVNATLDLDVLEYLALAMGPQRQPPEKLIPITVLYIGM